MTNTFDAIIIGGGNAGFGASAVLKEAGKSIAFIESHDFGGTCPNRGCTPKKVLVAAAHALHEIEVASTHGITVGKPIQAPSPRIKMHEGNANAITLCRSAKRRRPP